MCYDEAIHSDVCVCRVPATLTERAARLIKIADEKTFSQLNSQEVYRWC